MTHLVFDLDGTLVDSFPGIEFSVRSALASVVPDRAVPDIRPFIGPPVREVFRRALGEDDVDTLDRLELAFRQSYDGGGWSKTVAYPGVADCLAAVQKLGMVCLLLTNKPQRATLEILKFLSLAPFFEVVTTPDSRIPGYASKTAAALDLQQRLGLAGPETLFIGDSADDAAAAAACGYQFAAACFGYGTAHLECQSAVHFRLARFSDLLSIVQPAHS